MTALGASATRRGRPVAPVADVRARLRSRALAVAAALLAATGLVAQTRDSLLVDLATPRRPLVLAGEGPVRGLAPLGSDVVVLRGESLVVHSLEDGRLQRVVPAPAGARALVEHRGELVCLGADALTFHGADAAQVRRIPVPGVAAGARLAASGARLLLADGRALAEVDVASGALRRLPVELPADWTWLAPDEGVLWVAGATSMAAVAIEPTHAARCSRLGPRTWPVERRVAAGCWVAGRLLVASSAADGRAELTFVVGEWDPHPEPVVRVFVARIGSATKLELGPKPVADLVELRAGLERLAADPTTAVKWPRGERRLPPVAIVVGAGARFRDVDSVSSAARAAGFLDWTVAIR